MNMLVHGAKRWILFPPQDAFFTVQPVLQWLTGFTEERTHSDKGLYYTPGDVQECVQLPGDVVFVPELWGHAVVNLRPSIAVAYEFHE